MKRNKGQLSSEEIDIIGRYTGGATPAAIALEFGTSANVIHGILKRDHVQAEIRADRERVSDRIAGVMFQSADRCVAALVEIATDSEAPAAARIAASKVILDRVLPTGPAVAVQNNVTIDLSSVREAVDRAVRSFSDADLGLDPAPTGEE